ncbi:MAG: hypothetical protein H7A35_15255 [Planctomycetales bacterium]|nr:hypothetical protein [bacterium]UNM08188.1 MAG: hypothetical protein H7A35_15255 [Planctomycetales bacterium]
MLIRVPFEMKKRGGKREIKVAKEDFKADWRAQKPLLVSLALAFAWQEKLDAGEFENMNALAKHLNVDFSYLSRILNLTLLDPYIVEQIIHGREPSGTSLAKLQKGLPLNWDEQRRKYGFAPRETGNNCGIDNTTAADAEDGKPAGNLQPIVATAATSSRGAKPRPTASQASRTMTLFSDD